MIFSPSAMESFTGVSSPQRRRQILVVEGTDKLRDQLDVLFIAAGGRWSDGTDGEEEG